MEWKFTSIPKILGLSLRLKKPIIHISMCQSGFYRALKERKSCKSEKNSLKKRNSQRIVRKQICKQILIYLLFCDYLVLISNRFFHI